MEKIELCHKEGRYSYSLKQFFKDRFKIDGDVIYIIPSQYILSTSRTFFPKIREACNYVCPSDTPCNGRKFINYIQQIVDFLYYSIEEEKTWYKSFEFFPDEENKNFFGWSERPIENKCLKHLTYSRRLAYLKQNFTQFYFYFRLKNECICCRKKRLYKV